MKLAMAYTNAHGAEGPLPSCRWSVASQPG